MSVSLKGRFKFNRGGFALPMSLLALALLVTIALVSMTFIRIEMMSSKSHLTISQAKLNTIAAGRIALGELQSHIGRDQTATMTLDNGWVGAVSIGQDSSGNGVGTPYPLVSGSCYLETINKELFGRTELVPGREAGQGKLPPIEVPWLGDGEQGRGRFAFWVEDESQKIDVTTCETKPSMALPDIQARRQLCAQRHDLDLVLGVNRANLQAWREGLGRAATWKGLEQAWRSGEDEGDEFPLNKRLHTSLSLGVLADMVEGGLRINWDQRVPTDLSENQLPCSIFAWKGFFQDGAINSHAASAGFPIKPSTHEPALRNFPILTGLRVRFGFFNARSDGYHRARFHADVQMWNPTSYPMLAADEARVGLLDLENMPRLEIINHDTGGSISVDMGAFPSGQFGLAKQTASEATANIWVELLDGRRFGMASPGLLAGEVYNFSLPNPVSQPQGLSRVLSATTWKMQSDPAKPTKPPSGAKESNWFHATHRIELKGIMPSSGVTLHLREAKGAIATGVAPANYSPPALTLKNIPFRDFSLTLTGEEYNRKDSTSYQVDEARIGFSLKLRADDSGLLEDVLNSLDPRAPVLDFSDPRVAALYQVEQDVTKGVSKALTNSSQDGLLWDTTPNDHRGADIPFSEVRCMEGKCPVLPLSVGSLRHLPRSDQPAGCLVAKYPSGREADTTWFDRAFFAGAWPEFSNNFGGQLPWSRNPWLILRDGAPEDAALRDDAAVCCLIRGVFNVNCKQPEVWRVLLGRVIPRWQRRSGDQQAGSSPQELRNCVFRLPFGASEPRTVNQGKCDLSDAELRRASPDVWQYCASIQGFRALDDSTRDKLAAELCAAIQRRHIGEGPFTSLSEFARSGVIAEALEKSGCNAKLTIGGELPPISPLKLNSGDILESLLPGLAVRGDTFKVRLRGAVLSPLDSSKSSVDAEVIIQRFPEFCDESQPAMTPPRDLNPINRHLGRRLRIISWRWLDAGEWE